MIASIFVLIKIATSCCTLAEPSKSVGFIRSFKASPNSHHFPASLVLLSKSGGRP